VSRAALDAAAVARRLRHRRLELGMSTRQLAKLTGTTGVTIGELERGRNIDGQPVALLVRIADALALTLPELLAPSPRDEWADDNGDAAAVGALLHGQQQPSRVDNLARALEWTLPRVRHALEALDVHLEAAGLCVHTASGAVQLARAAGAIDDTSIERAAQARDRRDPVSTLHAQLVRYILTGALTPARQQPNANRVALGQLANAGVLTRDTTPALTDDVAYSLGIRATDEEGAGVRP
jgi:transcriptional regulator with XRE-family HTH domain